MLRRWRAVVVLPVEFLETDALYLRGAVQVL